jgi:hypothetical protein
LKRRFLKVKSKLILGALLAFLLAAASCDTNNPNPTPYAIGDTGSGGGIVFYDKGYTSDGWRYLEAAPASMVFPPANYIKYSSIHVGELIGDTGTAIGSGKQNTEIIMEQLHNWNDLEGRKVAAQLCVEFECGGKTDWFLPSRDELNEMFLSLGVTGLNEYALLDWTFQDGKTREEWGGWNRKKFWSSSEVDNKEAWVVELNGGAQYSSQKGFEYMVRPVRAF